MISANSSRFVRFTRGDGTVVPLEVYYDGIDDDGRQHWVATQTLDARADVGVGGKLQLDDLPDNSRVVVPTEDHATGKRVNLVYVKW